LHHSGANAEAGGHGVGDVDLEANELGGISGVLKDIGRTAVGVGSSPQLAAGLDALQGGQAR
jgi:hypothetical protein